MRLLLTLVLAALAACGADPERPKRTKQERQEAAEAQLAKTPVPRTYRYPDGELRVIDTPVPSILGDVELQRCFLWRDTELKTASLSCPQQPELIVRD